MTIQDAYSRYEIMPQLSLHMRRVAGVGKLILDGWREPIGHDTVMRTLLLHDMGNIVKFDLTEAGQRKLKSAEPEDLPRWRDIQAKYWKAYGKSAYEATLAIVKELHQEDLVEIYQADHEGYAKSYPALLLDQSPTVQILAYCDVRVVPSGVVPMKERIADLQRRYGRDLSWYDFLYQLEESVGAMTTTPLSSITEQSVAPFLPSLLQYPL